MDTRKTIELQLVYSSHANRRRLKWRRAAGANCLRIWMNF